MAEAFHFVQHTGSGLGLGLLLQIAEAFYDQLSLGGNNFHQLDLFRCVHTVQTCFNNAEGTRQMLFQKQRDQQEVLGGKLAETWWEMHAIPRENHFHLRGEAGNHPFSENLWACEMPTCLLFGLSLFREKATPREAIVVPSWPQRYYRSEEHTSELQSHFNI